MNWLSRMALYLVDLASPAMADQIMEDTVFSMLKNDGAGVIALAAIRGSPPEMSEELMETFAASFIEGAEEAGNVPTALRPRAKAAAKRALSRALGKEIA